MQNESPLAPDDLGDLRKFVDLYSKLAVLINEFLDKVTSIQSGVEPLYRINEIITSRLKDAGIKLSDSESILGTKLKEIRSENIKREVESTKLLDVIKTNNIRQLAILVALLVSIGIGVLDRAMPPNKTASHYYHLPPDNQWNYGDKMLWTVMDGDTIYKKP